MKELYPDVDINEILKKAKKSNVGIFYKEYKKADFKYVINKKPFKRDSIVALHIPTKTLFGYSTFFQTWDKLGFKFGDEIK